MDNQGTNKMLSMRSDLKFDVKSICSPFAQICKGHSPVSDLAMNLGELSANFHEKTPRRRLSLCSSGTPTPVAVALRPRFLASQLSADDGCCLDSPSPVDIESPFTLERFGKQEQVSPKKLDDIPSQAFKRFQSMPVPFCGFDPSPPNTQVEARLSDRLPKLPSPSEYEASPKLSLATSRHQRKAKRSPFKPLFDHNVPVHSSNNIMSPCASPASSVDENSQDSGVCCESKDSAFKFPIAPAPRTTQRLLSDESRSPLRYSPAAKHAPRTFKDVSKTLTGGVFKQSPLKQSPQARFSQSPDSDDDGIDVYDSLDFEDEFSDKFSAPSGLDSLLNARVLSADCQKEAYGLPTPTSRVWCKENQENIRPKNFRRGLFRSPSAPRLLQHKSHTMHAISPLCMTSPTEASPFHLNRPTVSSKRCSDSNCDDMTPRVSKRRKSITYDDGLSSIKSTLEVPKPSLHRCQSMSEAVIKSALNRQASCPDLLGDMSKSYSLPMCRSKHNDLKGISPETLAAVLKGDYDDVIEKCVIVDSRYPYEYKGGHIEGALNLYTKDQIMNEFFTKNDHILTKDLNKRTIIVFHCEFSSERGPKMSRFLRSQDRTMNKERYPFLNYPEIYLLENGYKRFFEEELGHCVPQTYKPMLQAGHEQDLKHFRAKSKSWAGADKSGVRGSTRTLQRSGLKF